MLTRSHERPLHQKAHHTSCLTGTGKSTRRDVKLFHQRTSQCGSSLDLLVTIRQWSKVDLRSTIKGITGCILAIRILHYCNLPTRVSLPRLGSSQCCVQPFHGQQTTLETERCSSFTATVVYEFMQFLCYDYNCGEYVTSIIFIYRINCGIRP
jgi:hypothetical protein